MSEEPNAEKLAKVYIKIRDRRRELEKEDKELKEQIDTIEAQLLEICKEQQFVPNSVLCQKGLVNIIGQVIGMRLTHSS